MIRHFVVAALIASFTPIPQQVSFEEALRQAKANTASEAGAKYDGDAGNAFSQGIVTEIPRCLDEAKKPSDFIIVMQIGAGGRVENAMVRPINTLTRCVLQAARKLQFPAPPSPHYWVFVNWNFKQQPPPPSAH